MDLTERFADAVGRRPFPLDEACTLIGAHGDDACAVDATLRRLDEMAASVARPALDSLLSTLFDDLGFVGDEDTFYDPRNSYLHAVIARRTGIPVTLSVVLIEVGRRLGVPVEGVGTPAHFVTRVPGQLEMYVDAFAGGTTMDRAGLDARFSLIAPGVDLDPYLAPLTGPEIVRRILGNLVGIHRRTGDRDGLLWSSQLLTLVPGSTSGDRRAFSDALAACGDFARAAKVLESLVDEGRSREPDRELAAAHRLRARLN